MKSSGHDAQRRNKPDHSRHADPYLTHACDSRGATFLGKNAEGEQSSLLAKVEIAESKVTEGKLTDAADKLLDVAGSAVALASAPKPKLEDASGITASVDAAVTCLTTF
jgi:hypothetical protein